MAKSFLTVDADALAVDMILDRDVGGTSQHCGDVLKTVVM
jgi:hypothetical protein